jgi:Skp family chaperone for outer membrane proteins
LPGKNDEETRMRILALIVFCLMLSACGNESADDAASKEDKETVFDPLIESVEKAKGVEDTVMQQKKDMDEAMQRMEEGTEDPDDPDGR